MVKKVFIAIVGVALAVLGAEMAWPQAQGVNIKSFGAIGDGNAHPLSQFYSSLTAAQAVYPFVSDLTQEVDWAATQAAVDYAYAHNNQDVYCPGVTGSGASYRLSLPVYIDPPTNFRAQNAENPYSPTIKYGLFAGAIYNGIAWASQATGTIGTGAVGSTPTVSNGYPGALAIAATQNGAAQSNLPFAPVTISFATPAVVGFNGVAHGLAAGTPFRFVTSAGTVNNVNHAELADQPPAGVMPIGTALNTAYYVLTNAGGVGVSTFTFGASPGGAAINTSSAGSGVFGISTQLWAIDPNPPGDSSFANRSNFIGDEGIPGNYGCRFTSLSNVGPAFIIGPNNGNFIKNVNVNGPGIGQGSPVGADYRCQRPDADNTSYVKGAAITMIGFDQITNGAGSRTKFENVGSANFYYGYNNGFNGGALGDLNSWDKSTFAENCYGLRFTQNQGFINTMVDSISFNSTIHIEDSLVAGINIFGGNFSSTYGQYAGFAITGPTVSGDTVTMTMTTPDKFMMHPLCGLNNQCAYNRFVFQTPHFGLVPMLLTSFNPFTKSLALSYDSHWLAQWSDTGLDATAQLTADIQAQTKVYAGELLTKLIGTGIELHGVHMEDSAAYTMLHSFTAFGGGKPNYLIDTYFNATITSANQVEFGCPPAQFTPTQCDAMKAQFFIQQVNPTIWIDGNGLIWDGAAGGADNIPERALIQTGGGMVQFRNTFGIAPANPAKNVLWQFRSAFSGNTFTGVAGLDRYTRDGGSSAFGTGEWDSGVGFLPATAGLSAQQSNDFRGTGWGQSPNWGLRPAPWASPCVTPAQVGILTGSLTPLTYSATLNNLALNATGSNYQTNDIVTLVGGTTSTQQETITVNSITVGGHIATATINGVGQYSVAPATFTSTGGHGTGATWGTASYDMFQFNVGYPLLWGGKTYEKCDWQLPAQPKYALNSTNVGYSYFQNLTTATIPNLSWNFLAPSPFINMNREALEVMFPGLVISLTGAGACTGPSLLMVTEVHIYAGYVATVNAAQDGTPTTPPIAAGTTCSGTSIQMQTPAILNPF